MRKIHSTAWGFRKKAGQEATPDGMTRRDFLGRGWKTIGIIAGLELSGMLAAFFISGKNKGPKEQMQLLEAGPVGSFGMNTVSAFPGGRFYLARQQDGGFIALSQRCTHLGCAVAWEEEKKRFICPCHASSFDIHGDVINPPAPRALSYFPVVVEGGVVKVDVSTLKERNVFRNDQLTYAP